MMTLAALPIAAALLSLERISYIGIARAPRAFSRWCAGPWVARFGDPVAVVQKLFVAFKTLQLLVFVGWCYAHEGASWRSSDQDALVLAVAVVAGGIGQFLVLTVFYRLGRAGVFYGDRLGHDVPWCHGFPFSVLSHPQYVGTVLTIWAFFLATRFPHADWYLLPALETIYHVAGATLERAPTRREPETGAGALVTAREAEMAQRDGRVGRAAHGRLVRGGAGAATLSHDLG
jgi:phosphatidyl-N-methylethanolamine N-methyltransferase